MKSLHHGLLFPSELSFRGVLERIAVEDIEFLQAFFTPRLTWDTLQNSSVSTNRPSSWRPTHALADTDIIHETDHNYAPLQGFSKTRFVKTSW